MIQTQAAMNAVRIVVIRGNVRAGISAQPVGAGSLFHACDLVSHEFISRPRTVPGRGRFADRKNVSHGASAQNRRATVPTRYPGTFSIPLGTIPARLNPAIQAGRMHKKPRGRFPAEIWTFRKFPFGAETRRR